MNTANIDEYIGSKIRARRHILGLSQTELGNKIGVTFQQIQKYEKGHNKIVAARLLEVANIMSVPISYFFEDLINSKISSIEGNQFDENNEDESANEEQQTINVNNREVITLIKIYNNINNKTTRKKLLTFLKSLTQE